MLTVRYWEQVQQKLQRDELPELSMYPESSRLSSDAAQSGEFSVAAPAVAAAHVPL